jgi:RNA polymerase sigma-70 factor (sigma-E family)
MSQDPDDYVRESRPRLLRAARLITGSWTDAEDLLQEGLARTFTRWSRLDNDAVRDRYVLTTMARLYARDARRKWRGETPTFPLPEPVAEVDEAEAHGIVLEALKTLTPGQRTAVVYRYYLDMDVRETARAMRCTQGNVRGQTAKGISRLREQLMTKEVENA